MKQLFHIVCMGGGNAMPKAVLEGLKNYPVRISAVSAMLDSGGSAGKERELFKTKVSFGDFRRAALALSEASAENKTRFSFRYNEGPLANHVLANIYCTASATAAFDFEKAIEDLQEDIKEDLEIPQKHCLLPATLEDAVLCTELVDGQIIKGEGNIDIPKHDASLKIRRIFLEPEARAYSKTLAAIKRADLISIGPGDLFSSLAQILLVRGIPEAIRQSKAKKVYICNLMTKNGETNGFSVSDFTEQIEKFLGKNLDYVIYNNFFPLSEAIKEYQEEHPDLLEPVEIDQNLPKDKFLGANLIKEGSVEHDPKKLSRILTLLI